jgi:hypothetical protein
MDVDVSSIVDKIPAIDLNPRGRGEEWHGGKRRKSERQHAVRGCICSAELTCDS